MDKLTYYPGLNSAFGYCSDGVSLFGAHREDWNFASFNILFKGQIKLWIVVKPSNNELFERKIRELFPKAGPCTQFMRYLGVAISPSLLREWKVEFSLIPQKPGQLVAVGGKTYHWGMNNGSNYAEAINFCMERQYSSHDLVGYKACDGCAHEGQPILRPVLESRPLEERIKVSTAETEHDALQASQGQRTKDSRKRAIRDEQLAERRTKQAKRNADDQHEQLRATRCASRNSSPLSVGSQQQRSGIQHRGLQQAPDHSSADCEQAHVDATWDPKGNRACRSTDLAAAEEHCCEDNGCKGGLRSPVGGDDGGLRCAFCEVSSDRSPAAEVRERGTTTRAEDTGK
jgi:hypothetical protein